MKKVLIVEDDKFLLSAYRVKLTKAGFEIKIATDGEEALKILREDKPDVILLDLVMPRKDGFAVLEELKTNPVWKSIPVIVLSNLSQKEDLEKAKALGAKDYLIKSDLSLKDLVEKINTLIGT